MRESFLSCLPALASQPVIQSIPQTEAFFFPLPLDVLYPAGMLLQLDIKPCFGNRINNILPNLTAYNAKQDCANKLLPRDRPV